MPFVARICALREARDGVLVRVQPGPAAPPGINSGLFRAHPHERELHHLGRYCRAEPAQERIEHAIREVAALAKSKRAKLGSDRVKLSVEQLQLCEREAPILRRRRLKQLEAVEQRVRIQVELAKFGAQTLLVLPRVDGAVAARVIRCKRVDEPGRIHVEQLVHREHAIAVRIAQLKLALPAGGKLAQRNGTVVIEVDGASGR
mmetsp:Transcript_9260/g.29203  ORF Transcript_9260/g.29203 Transcript_9260/m.29203 type:complete len:203 (-) Transcript_9260:27-635(-)